MSADINHPSCLALKFFTPVGRLTLNPDAVKLFSCKCGVNITVSLLLPSQSNPDHKDFDIRDE